VCKNLCVDWYICNNGEFLCCVQKSVLIGTFVTMESLCVVCKNLCVDLCICNNGEFVCCVQKFVC